MVATLLAADCGGQSCMAAAGWHGTLSSLTALVWWVTFGFFLGGGTLWWFCMESLSVSMSQFDRTLFASWRCCVTCVDVPIRPAKLFEWSCVRRGLMSQSNPLMLLSCVSFLFTDYSLSGLYFCIFSAILIEMHLSSVVRLKKNLLYPSNREIHPY